MAFPEKAADKILEKITKYLPIAKYSTACDICQRKIENTASVPFPTCTHGGCEWSACQACAAKHAHQPKAMAAATTGPLGTTHTFPEHEIAYVTIPAPVLRRTSAGARAALERAREKAIATASASSSSSASRSAIK